MTDNMVIVGAGECGVRAAQALREEGFAGRVTLVGAESHLPYERPPLSKAMMTGEARSEPPGILSRERLTELDIDFRPALTVTAIDRPRSQVVFGVGQRLPFDRLLLATGSSPRLLPLADTTSSGLAYLRTFADAQAIRARLVRSESIAIIGGGFIGLELAASARLLGVRVTLIEAQARLLARAVPAKLAAMLEARHRHEGVDLFLGTAIAGLTTTPGKTKVVLTDGRTIEADLIVVGIGTRPTTALAEAAGLAIDNGIAVDATLATLDPRIFAAGDCCSFPLPLYGHRRIRLESWRNAQDQGTLAAQNMLGAGASVSSVPWFWSDQYDLGIQIAGLPDEGVDVATRQLSDGAHILFHISNDGRLVAASGIGPGNAIARDIRLAEMLIAKRARPPKTALADPTIKLKSLLAAA